MGLFNDLTSAISGGLSDTGDFLGEKASAGGDLLSSGAGKAGDIAGDVGKSALSVIQSDEAKSATSGLGDIFKANTPSALIGQTTSGIGDLFKSTGLQGLVGKGGPIGSLFGGLGKNLKFIALAVIAVVILLVVLK